MRDTQSQILHSRKLDTLVSCPGCHGERRTEAERDNPGGEAPTVTVSACDACDGDGTMTADKAALWLMRNADTADDRCRAGALALRLWLIDKGADGVAALAAYWRSYGYDTGELTDMVDGVNAAYMRAVTETRIARGSIERFDPLKQNEDGTVSAIGAARDRIDDALQQLVSPLLIGGVFKLLAILRSGAAKIAEAGRS